MKRTFFLLVAMLIASVTAMAQNVSISGKVADANGEPLIGVSILVQGTTTGTMTDVDGNFALDVPAGAINHYVEIFRIWSSRNPVLKKTQSFSMKKQSRLISIRVISQKTQ